MLEGFEQIVFHFLVISASLCGMPAQCQINFRVLVSKLHSLVNGCSVKTDHIVEGNPISLAKSNSSWTRPSNCSTLRWVWVSKFVSSFHHFLSYYCNIFQKILMKKKPADSSFCWLLFIFLCYCKNFTSLTATSS